MVVAEGVEDEATRHLLALRGCDVIQGYLISRPLPADAFSVWLRDRPQPPEATHPGLPGGQVGNGNVGPGG